MSWQRKLSATAVCRAADGRSILSVSYMLASIMKKKKTWSALLTLAISSTRLRDLVDRQSDSRRYCGPSPRFQNASGNAKISRQFRVPPFSNCLARTYVLICQCFLHPRPPILFFFIFKLAFLSCKKWLRKFGRFWIINRKYHHIISLLFSP